MCFKKLVFHQSAVNALAPSSVCSILPQNIHPRLLSCICVFFSLYCDASQKSSVWRVGVKTLHTIESYKLVHISRKLPRRTAQKNSATARISFERSLCICPHYVPSTFDPNVQVIPLKGRKLYPWRVAFVGDLINIIAMTEPTCSVHKQHQLPTDMKRGQNIV